MKPAIIVLTTSLWIAVGTVLVFLAFSGGLTTMADNVMPYDCAAQFDKLMELRENWPENVYSMELGQRLYTEINQNQLDFHTNKCTFTIHEWKDDVKHISEVYQIDWTMLQDMIVEWDMKK